MVASKVSKKEEKGKFHDYHHVTRCFYNKWIEQTCLNQKAWLGVGLLHGFWQLNGITIMIICPG